MSEEIIKHAREYCDQLREDGTCTWKDDKLKQHCTINPNMCCAICCYDVECDAKNGICTWLY